jgi:hypothetical protein
MLIRMGVMSMFTISMRGVADGVIQRHCATSHASWPLNNERGWLYPCIRIFMAWPPRTGVLQRAPQRRPLQAANMGIDSHPCP